VFAKNIQLPSVWSQDWIAVRQEFRRCARGDYESNFDVSSWCLRSYETVNRKRCVCEIWRGLRVISDSGVGFAAGCAGGAVG
jgi:hypothetical protein